MYKVIGVLISLKMLMLTISCVSMEASQRIDKNMSQAKFLEHADASGTDLSNRCRKHINEASRLKRELIEEGSSSSALATLNRYNEILIHLDSAISESSLFSHVHPLEEIRKNAELCEQESASFMTNLSLDHDVYQTLKNIDDKVLDEKASRMLSNTLRDFRRSGVDKDEATRNKIKSIKEELVTIGQEFGQNIRNQRLVIELNTEDLAGLPDDYIKSHQPNKNGKIEISTDYPDYVPFMKYAQSDDYRKKLRFKYLNRAPKNEMVLKRMIEKRYELAKLLGYNSYADYIVEDKMIKEASAIHSLIEKISSIAKDGADEEFKTLLTFKRSFDKNAKTIEGHESAFIEEAFKKDHFKFDPQSIRSYFSYPRVRDGLLTLTSKLFDIRYEKVSDHAVWDHSVEAYDVYDESGKLGRIYLDMHPRDGKYKHAAQFTLKSGILNRQYAEGVLVCNFPNPKDGDVALMEHSDVVTFFHEFGHLLHHIFAGRQQWMPFSGVATEWDFVEAPSQLFEEWAWSPEVLSTFATHYESNKVIPADLVLKMREAEEFGKAISIRQQMFYAALSANYYDRDPKSFDLLKLLKEMQAKYSYFPYEEGTHFYYSFGHLDGYSAMYYTYALSLSIAKDLYTPFSKTGLMNTDLARRYRDIILKQGGSKDANTLVEEFLGRPFQFDAFEAWLKTSPLATNQH